MSAQDSITLHHEDTSPLMGHSTAWNIQHEGRPFYVVMHRQGEQVTIRIDAVDTRRPIQPTSKRGTAIVSMVHTAYHDRFNDVDLEDLPIEDDEQTPERPARTGWPVPRSKSDNGVMAEVLLGFIIDPYFEDEDETVNTAKLTPDVICAICERLDVPVEEVLEVYRGAQWIDAAMTPDLRH